MTRPLFADGLPPLLGALAERAGARPMVEEVQSTPWASITFSGVRHRIALRFESEGARAHAQAMTEGLDYAEFDLGRHILADIAVTKSRIAANEAHLVIEALTIEND